MNADDRLPFDLEIRPGHVWSFHELPPRSIALDGAVQGPQLDPATRRYSFDHHAGCVRLVTSATCRQVWDALLLGLNPTGYRVLLNDLDGDTVLSVFLLASWTSLRSPATREDLYPLVQAVADGDAHGPAYPLLRPDLACYFHTVVLQGLRSAREMGFPDGERQALLDALQALHRFLAGGLQTALTPPSFPAEQKLKIIHDGRFVMAVSEGTTLADAGLARRLYDAGHQRIVLGAPLQVGRYRYTLAKRSDFVDAFPIDRLLRVLNQEEERTTGSPLGLKARWGGASTIGGSPRPEGSRLTPEQVRQVVGDELEQAESRS